MVLQQTPSGLHCDLTLGACQGHVLTIRMLDAPPTGAAASNTQLAGTFELQPDPAAVFPFSQLPSKPAASQAI